MCLHKMARYLYEKLQKVPVFCLHSQRSEAIQKCDSHIKSSVLSLSEKLHLDSVDFLTHLDQMWKMHCSQMKKIGSIFLYLDRTYVICSSGTPPALSPIL